MISRILNKMRGYLNALVLFDNYLLLKAPVSYFVCNSLDHEFCVERFDRDESGLYHALNKLDQQYGPNLEQIRSRLVNNLVFYVLTDRNGVFVASTWIHPAGQRFIDEVGYLFSPVEDSIWVRDIYVGKEQRGKGAFVKLLQAVIALDYQDKKTIWSDISKSNIASSKAHKNAEFQLICSIPRYTFFCKFTFRSFTKNPELSLRGFDIASPLLVCGSKYKDYKHRHLS